MLPRDVNEDQMQRAATVLIGEHDFTSFRGSACQSKSSIRCIDEFKVVVIPPQYTRYTNSKILQITCKARSFLYHQMRNMVSTLVAVGTHAMTIDDVYRILKSKDRRLAPQTAPAQGLYLQDVQYPSDMLDRAKQYEEELKKEGLMDIRS
jgi:tRNA pseudouridine38-40 synthase